MKKQEMIDLILQEEKKLWKDLQECIDRLGIYDPITDSATARWSAVQTLALKILKK